MMVYLVIVPTLLLHLAFAGCRVNLSLFALHLDASPLVVGIILSLLALLPMTFAVGAGRIIDRIGVRKPMLLATVVVILGLIIGVVFPQIEALYLVSLIVGGGYTHSWRVGDYVMWDNRSTLHRGLRYDLAQRRDLRRTTTLERHAARAAVA